MVSFYIEGLVGDMSAYLYKQLKDKSFMIIGEMNEGGERSINLENGEAAYILAMPGDKGLGYIGFTAETINNKSDSTISTGAIIGIILGVFL